MDENIDEMSLYGIQNYIFKHNDDIEFVYNTNE